MKIASLELFLVPPRWLFLKVTTDEGIAGWGEPVVEGRAATVKTAVEELSDYLIGKDPFRIEDHFQVMYRGGFYRGGPVLTSALSGVEQALWDIKGKALGVPVYELLGGAARDRMRIYSWVGGDRPAEVGEAVSAQAALGMTAVKMNGTEELHYIDSHAKVEAAVARLAAAREAGGPGFGIGVDFHGRVHKSMAKVLMREMEPYHPLFIEEPVLPENNEALRELARHTTVPIAVGERMFTRWDFKGVLADGCVDILQPDLSHAGGILEVRKIAAMAEAYDVAVAPHCPLGPIALAACLQLDAAIPNFLAQEGGRITGEGYIKEPFRHQEGYLPLPTAPGLGIELDEEALADKIDHDWQNPKAYAEDGSAIDW